MIKTLNEIMKVNPNLTYKEAEKIQNKMRTALEDEVAGYKTSPGVCITAAVRKDVQQNKPLTDEMKEAKATIKKLEIENDLLRDKLQVKILKETVNQ